MRVCFDTNVLVSAFATRGLAADALRVVLAEHELLVPELVLDEFGRVLRRKLRAPEGVVSTAEQLLRLQTVVPMAPVPAEPHVRDRSDARIRAAAGAGGAEVLVTGDRDLLDAAASSPIPVVTPRELWSRLRAGR